MNVLVLVVLEAAEILEAVLKGKDGISRVQFQHVFS